jgi:ATP-dependent Clp protease ATP-binding subunit ClpC
MSSTDSSLDPSMKQGVSVLSHLDARSSQVLSHANEEAKKLKKEQIEPDLLLYGLLFDQEIFTLLQGFSVDVGALSKEIQAKQTPGNFSGEPKLADETTKVFQSAFNDVKNRGISFISPEDILVALCSLPALSPALAQKGIVKEQVLEKLNKSNTYHSGKKSVLEQYGIDLTQEAKDGKLDPIAGRDKEIERVVHILLRRSKNNPIIIGEAGVGKTAIVEGLAEAMVTGKAPKELADKKIIQLDLASLVAGASHRGEFEERLRDVIKETIAAEGQIILFIDEIHTLIGAGDTDGALDASNIIKPYLARGQMRIIGTTTTSEYRKHFEKDKAFERRFQSVLVDEPSEEAALLMLQVLRPKYEKFHGVTFSDETLKDAVHLSKKYIGERFLPDKAVDLLDEAAADVKLQHGEGKRQETAVNKEDIEKVVSSWTGIPITKLTEDEGEKLLHLADLIHKRLIGQDEAVQAVTEAVQRGRIGLSSASRPIASFIFLGPTGVGKTELAKTLAEILFGKEDAMIRLDMSEYMEKHEVAKLIGALPGYVGYEEGGQLTEAVRRKPYSIVLLDEIEKAHPDVFNILLQLLEDGRLTDNKGNTISFKNTIIIATSNIGSALIQQQMSKAHGTEEEYQKDFAQLNTLLSDELHKFFKPELLNRFDEIVVFKPLAQADMASIAKNNVAKTAHLLQEQGYDLQITQSALMQLAQEGYDPVYGARPLRRLIQTSIENPIAVKIIGKAFTPPDTILVNFDPAKSEFLFSKSSGDAQNAPEEQKTDKSATPTDGTSPTTVAPTSPVMPSGISSNPQMTPAPALAQTPTDAQIDAPVSANDILKSLGITDPAAPLTQTPTVGAPENSPTPPQAPAAPRMDWTLPPTQEFTQTPPVTSPIGEPPAPPTTGAAQAVNS